MSERNYATQKGTTNVNKIQAHNRAVEKSGQARQGQTDDQKYGKPPSLPKGSAAFMRSLRQAGKRK